MGSSFEKTTGQAPAGLRTIKKEPSLEVIHPPKSKAHTNLTEGRKKRGIARGPEDKSCAVRREEV